MSFLGNVVDSWEEICEKYGMKISEENLKVLMFVEYMWACNNLYLISKD